MAVADAVLGVKPTKAIRPSVLIKKIKRTGLMRGVIPAKFIVCAAVVIMATPLSDAHSQISSEGVSVSPAKDLILTETPDQRDARMQWWRQARFGMFIHWGIYSIPAGKWGKRTDYSEWIMNSAQIPVAQYKDIASHFNPSRYHPKAWADLAQNAGMRYMVITAKHHDGFALWPSKASSWNIADATPYKADLLGPLVEAAHADGLKIGFYYSQAQDWVNPGGAKAHFPEGAGWDEAQKGSFDVYLHQTAEPQVKELLTAYPVDLLWWDTPVNMTRVRAQPLAKLLNLRPNLIVNDRLGGDFKGDYATAEQAIPLIPIAGDWEACMTINDHWGYNSSDLNFKPYPELLRDLVEIVSKGGNLLLNVSPDSNGEIPSQMVERLRKIGEWMRSNGDSIYGTTAGPFDFAPYGAVTAKEGHIFVHVFNWPETGIVRLPLRNKTVSAYLLSAPSKKLVVRHDNTGLTIEVPSKSPDPVDSVLVIDVDGAPLTAPLVTQGANVTADFEDGETYSAAHIIDNDMGTTWRAPHATTTATAQIVLKSKQTVAGFGFSEPDVWPRMSQHYTVEARVNGAWRRLDEGDTTGHGIRQEIHPVTTSSFKITITDKDGAPGLSEIRFYPNL